MIIPRPESMKTENKLIPFTAIDVSGEQTDFADNYLLLFLPDRILNNQAADLTVLLKQTEGYSENGYFLKAADEITVEFSKTEGLRNALSSLIQLIRAKDGQYLLQAAEINDFSPCKYRSVMIDLARGLPEPERLKEDLRRLALAKCNNVHFHLMDEMGICYLSDIYKSVDDIRGTARYSKATMREIAAYCDTLGISVVPEIEIPAHAGYLVKMHSELRCDTDIENQSDWCVCAGNDKTYEFYDALVGEVASLFKGEYLHIGGDELYFGDFPEWNALCHWDECRTCRKVMEEQGMRDKWDLYALMVRRMNEIVKKHGKKMIMWNDQIDFSVPRDIPRDIIMQFWRISDRNRGPRSGCNYNALTKEFKVINADYSKYYVDCEDYATPEKASIYNYLNYPKAEHPENVLGGESCAWEYGNPAVDHYELSFACTNTVLLDKLWNTEDVLFTPEYRAALTRLVLGAAVPEDYDMTELFDSLFPPRTSGKYTYISEGASPDDDFYVRHLSALDCITETYSPRYLRMLREREFKDYNP